jgi:hypothetical protein
MVADTQDRSRHIWYMHYGTTALSQEHRLSSLVIVLAVTSLCKMAGSTVVCSLLQHHYIPERGHGHTQPPANTANTTTTEESELLRCCYLLFPIAESASSTDTR